MESFVTSNNGKDASRYGNKLSTLNEGISSGGNREYTPAKQKSTNAYDRRKRRHVLSWSSITDSKDQDCPSPNKPNPTHTQPNQNDNTPTNVIGVEAIVCCTDTRVGTAPSPINDVIPWP
jgi:hypothetical protein